MNVGNVCIIHTHRAQSKIDEAEKEHHAIQKQISSDGIYTSHASVIQSYIHDFYGTHINYVLDVSAAKECSSRA